jgi:hypothetical protein
MALAGYKDRYFDAFKGSFPLRVGRIALDDHLPSVTKKTQSAWVALTAIEIALLPSIAQNHVILSQLKTELSRMERRRLMGGPLRTFSAQGV